MKQVSGQRSNEIGLGTTPFVRMMPSFNPTSHAIQKLLHFLFMLVDFFYHP